MNPLLVFAFFGVSTITLGTVVLVMRPSSDQKAVDKRLSAIQAKQGEFAPVNERLDQFLKPKAEGQFGWLEEVFEGSQFARNIQIMIVQADRATTMGAVLMSCMIAGVIAALAVYLFTGMIYAVVPGAIAGGYIPLLMLKIRRNRRLNAFNRSLADNIDMMARSLRAGHSLVAAISIVAEQAPEPAKSEFGEVFKKQNFGLPMREALMQMLDRVPSQDLRVLVTGILVQKDTGGNLAEILDRIVVVIRERVRIKGEIKTHTAQGRLTGWILCLLPVVMLLLINVINPGYSSVLFHDPSGQKILGVGLILLCLGGLTIRQIINGIEV
jgi:tight adherence protein B